MGERITSEEQVRRWALGEPVHRDIDGETGGECCPDFSCCKPELLADVEVRRAFEAADGRGRRKWLVSFLGAAIANAAPEKKVHIAGTGDPEVGS